MMPGNLQLSSGPTSTSSEGKSSYTGGGAYAGTSGITVNLAGGAGSTLTSDQKANASSPGGLPSWVWLVALGGAALVWFVWYKKGKL